MNCIERIKEGTDFSSEPKVILVSGSRYWSSNEHYNKIKTELQKYPNAIIIVGDCRGVDALALRAAKDLNYAYKVFKADWNKYGNAAGPIRNKKMIDELKGYLNEKLILAFHDDIENSKGTKNLIKLEEGLDIKLIN